MWKDHLGQNQEKQLLVGTLEDQNSALIMIKGDQEDTLGHVLKSFTGRLVVPTMREGQVGLELVQDHL